jgi:hypothetical protein
VGYLIFLEVQVIKGGMGGDAVDTRKQGVNGNPVQISSWAP